MDLIQDDRCLHFYASLLGIRARHQSCRARRMQFGDAKSSTTMAYIVFYERLRKVCAPDDNTSSMRGERLKGGHNLECPFWESTLGCRHVRNQASKT